MPRGPDRPRRPGGERAGRRDRRERDRPPKRAPEGDPAGAAAAAGAARGGGHGPGHQARHAIDVGSTANKPELVETIPIVTKPGKGKRVALSLGPDTDTDVPLPELGANDRLVALAELELTTDAEDSNHPGLIGKAYSYSPKVEATMLLAADPGAIEAKRGQAIELVAKSWRQTVSHERHHAVITFDDGGLAIPAGGLPWRGPSYVNLVVSATHPDAKPGDVLLVGQNEKTPVVVQDMGGIRIVRYRPGSAKGPKATVEAACMCKGIAIAKQRTVVLAHRLSGLAKGERLLVKGRLVTDATGLPAPARISTRLFLADGPDEVEPGGVAGDCMSWKGHLSKYTGFNCLPNEGPQPSRKFGVATVRKAPGADLYVNLVAVSAAPFGGAGPRDQLRIDTTRSELEVTRFPAPK